MNPIVAATWPYRWVIVASLFAVAVTTGYIKGIEHGASRAAKCEATVDVIHQIGKQQEIKTQATIARQKVITRIIDNESSKSRRALDSVVYPAGVLLKPFANSGNLPKFSNAASGADERTAEPSACSSQLATCYRAAANDALTVLLWQEWVTEQMNIPQ